MILISSHVVWQRKSLIIVVFHEEQSKWVETPWKEKMNLTDPTLLDLFCVFEDGSKTKAINSEMKGVGSELGRFLECELSPVAESSYSRHQYLQVLLYENNYQSYLAKFNSTPLFDKKTQFQLMLCGSPWNELPANFIEWMEYYHHLGVQHTMIYLCHPKLSMNYTIIHYYEKLGWLTTVNWCPDYINDYQRSMQNLMNIDCLYKSMDFTKWLLIIDQDEFVFPATDKLLTDVLNRKGNTNVGFLRVQNTCFLVLAMVQKLIW